MKAAERSICSFVTGSCKWAMELHSRRGEHCSRQGAKSPEATRRGESGREKEKAFTDGAFDIHLPVCLECNRQPAQLRAFPFLPNTNEAPPQTDEACRKL